MDYTELAKSIRETDFSDGCPCGAEPLCEGEDCIIVQAADAIEGLLQELSLYEERTKFRFVKNDDGTTKVLFETQWISVTERLPEEYTTILFVSTSDQVYIGYYDSEHKSFCDMTGFRYVVTHWMLAPQPPKEET